jgi:hypothetical protein
MESVNNEEQIVTILSKLNVIDYIEHNDAMYYKIEIIRGQSSVFSLRKKLEAIKAIKDAKIELYELEVYNQIIHLYQTCDLINLQQ